LEMNRVSQKIALVTGATGGIGLAIVKKLHDEGATVIATDLPGAQTTIFSERVIWKTLDVTDEQDWEGVMQDVAEQLGRLDILVNCAGFFKPNVSFEDTSLDLWRQHFAVNSDGVFLGCKHAIKSMKSTGGGCIVNISSGLALRVSTKGPAYSASKAAVIATTKLAALHSAENGYGIRVNCILPGPVDTPMLKRNVSAGESEEDYLNKIAQSHPIGRIGQSHEIADAVVFLCSDESSFITASTLAVDGGQLAD
jgi:NAD(P)-dependent dehydrogenase (short-subunit alcohol dehydrogenase family)